MLCMAKAECRSYIITPLCFIFSVVSILLNELIATLFNNSKITPCQELRHLKIKETRIIIFIRWM